MKDLICKKVTYSGQVQGVGFRWQSLELSKNLKLQGYIMNLPDGRVELIAQGSKTHVEELLSNIKIKLGHYILSSEITDEDTQPLNQFQIKK